MTSALIGMTEAQVNTLRKLVYLAREIAHCMVQHPEMTARQIAGDAGNPDDEITQLVRAIEAAGPIIYPAWGYRQRDEKDSEHA